MKSFRQWWRWWARGMRVFVYRNTTGANRIMYFGAAATPIVLQPGETIEITVYPE